MKAIELYFLKKLSNIGGNAWQEIVSDKFSVVNDETITDEERITAIKKFVEEKVLDSITMDTNTEAVVKALRNIVDNDKSVFDINKSVATLLSNDVELMFVVRNDAPAESPLEEDSEIKTLIVNKVIYDSKLTCCGYGRAHLYAQYDEDICAFDFVDFFEMTPEEMKDNNVFNEFSKWEVLKNKDNGGKYIEDSSMIQYMKTLGYDYYYIYM